MGRKTIWGAALIAGLLCSAPAVAQAVCGERGAFVTQLSERYGEGLTAVGLINDGSLLEVLTSEQGSWTLLVTQPNGITCIVAAGEAWEPVPRVAMGPGA